MRTTVCELLSLIQASAPAARMSCDINSSTYLLLFLNSRDAVAPMAEMCAVHRWRPRGCKGGLWITIRECGARRRRWERGFEPRDLTAVRELWGEAGVGVAGGHRWGRAKGL